MVAPTTVDALLDGALVIEQPAPGHGYRANADALLLARFAAESRRRQRVIDLGSGVGTVALALHTLAPVRSVTFVERDEFAGNLALRNAARAGLGERATLAIADVGRWARTCGTAHDSVVVANPPYTQPGAGRRGVDPARDAARHGELEPFITAMQLLLAPASNHACICYPASNVLDAIVGIEAAGLAIQRMRFVHPKTSRPARIVLLEVVVEATATAQVMSPWFDS